MDVAPPQSAGLKHRLLPREAVAGVHPLDGIREFAERSGRGIEEFWQDAEADYVDLTQAELAATLLALGGKYNYGFPPGERPSTAQACGFWRALQLRDLALAQACALGRDAAWRMFLSRYKEPLKQTAIGITGSVSLGNELAPQRPGTGYRGVTAIGRTTIKLLSMNDTRRIERRELLTGSHETGGS